MTGLGLFLTIVALITGIVGCNQPECTPVVAASGYHTVGLKSDGTVVAVGDNYYRQCDVGSWTDIAQIAAGYRHTAGLEADGTVVAVGHNYNG
jgi:alpha-tubulin suppressor-like RCC1 family protein